MLRQALIESCTLAEWGTESQVWCSVEACHCSCWKAHEQSLGSRALQIRPINLSGFIHLPAEKFVSWQQQGENYTSRSWGHPHRLSNLNNSRLRSAAAKAMSQHVSPCLPLHSLPAAYFINDRSTTCGLINCIWLALAMQEGTAPLRLLVTMSMKDYRNEPSHWYFRKRGWEAEKSPRKRHLNHTDTLYINTPKYSIWHMTLAAMKIHFSHCPQNIISENRHHF